MSNTRFIFLGFITAIIMSAGVQYSHESGYSRGYEAGFDSAMSTKISYGPDKYPECSFDATLKFISNSYTAKSTINNFESDVYENLLWAWTKACVDAVDQDITEIY